MVDLQDLALRVRGAGTLYVAEQILREAFGSAHIVDFSATGYGLQHPVECRPDLIGCHVNRYLAGLDAPEEPPGRYVVRLTPDQHEHGRWRAWYEPVAPSGVGGGDG